MNSKASHPVSNNDGAHPSVRSFGSRPALDELHYANLSQGIPLVPASHSCASSPRGCPSAPPMPSPEPETVAVADGCPLCILSVMPAHGRHIGVSNFASKLKAFWFHFQGLMTSLRASYLSISEPCFSYMPATRSSVLTKVCVLCIEAWPRSQT